MQKDKYALLDTDFISKTHIIQKDKDNHLIDRIMELPQYYFYCHSQIRAELARHNVSGSKEWLEKKILEGKIICYSDEKILNELGVIYGSHAPLAYVNLLRTACQAYRDGYFEEKFEQLQQLDYRNISHNDFIEELDKDCANIGTGQNLGEIKTYVLLRVIFLLFGEQIYVFCSDDRNARSAMISIGGVRCISVLSSFLRLKKECDFQQEDARDYIQSWLGFCTKSNQITFKVQENSNEKRLIKIPCERVMREIYAGKFEDMLNGNLRYK
ncbi:MAG: hypothetical protein NC548_46060 [Lachnospiraceae bacterium]|nr:hypothetical protein [Lachnospiraceae bacterium]